MSSTVEVKLPNYIFLTKNSSFYPSLLRGIIERPGLYNWIRAFRGGKELNTMIKLWAEFQVNPAKLNQFDIIHVNLAGGDWGIPAMIRDVLDRETKLVVNLDYSVEHMQKQFRLTQKSAEVLATDIASADMVFGVEPMQINFINWLMKATKQDKRAVLMPHPIDCEHMSKPISAKGMFVPFDLRMNKMAYMWHRYDQHLTVPRTIMSELPTTEAGEGVMRVLFGWRPEGMTIPSAEDMLDEVVPMKGWNHYVYELCHCLWGFEYRTHHAASRFILECAALGIPCVSTNHSFLGKIIFPELTTRSDDFEGLNERLARIVGSEKERLRFAKQGLKRVQNFSLSNSRNLFLKNLYGQDSVPTEEDV